VSTCPACMLPETVVTNPAGGVAWADEAGQATMKAAFVTDWCEVGTVADAILLASVPVPPAPVKSEVTIGVKATAINVDDIAALQDTAGGGWCFHFATPEESKPVRVTKPPSLMPAAASGQRGRFAPPSDLECSACSWWAAASGQAWCLLWAPTASG
jgi:hypothetical protein